MKDGYRQSRDRQGWGTAIGCPAAIILWFAFGFTSLVGTSMVCGHAVSPTFPCTALGMWVVLAAHLLAVLATFAVVRWVVDRLLGLWRGRDE